MLVGLTLITVIFSQAWAAEGPDWSEVDREATALLSGYLSVPNANDGGPDGGRETLGAAYLASFLEPEGIDVQIDEFAPGRGNLIARLDSPVDAAPPICLLSHIDVVPAESDSWSQPPYSGFVDDEGQIWGRGALDMKGLGAAQAMAMMLVARSGVVLDRDVVLLAVGDEEVDNRGIKHLVENRWDEIGCSHVLNEGGIGLEDLIFEGQTVFPISVGEKGVLWLRMVASGEPGHGSTPRPDSSPARLVAALAAIAERREPTTWHPATLELFARAGAAKGGIHGVVLGNPLLLRPLLRRRFKKNSVAWAALIDTVNLTGMGGAMQPNVVPGESWANLDIRIQPGTVPDDIIAELTALVDDPQVRFEVLSSEPAVVSEWRGDPFYESLLHQTEAVFPGSVAGPAISVGFTDSIYLRPLGVRAYGLAPFSLSSEEVKGFHGNDERLHRDDLLRGVQIVHGLILDVAGPS